MQDAWLPVLSAKRVAALYDIHGNSLALDAVLKELAPLDVDVILVGGDIVWGPYPQVTLQRLQQLGPKAVFLRGNADRDVAEGLGPADGTTPEIAEISNFCARQLRPTELEWLRRLPTSVMIEIEGLGVVHFCHASPRSDEEILTPMTGADRIRASAGDVRGIIVCGHTHVQFDVDIGDIRLINAGSVGLAYEDKPGAYWTLFGPDVEPRHTPLSVDQVVRSIRTSGCPYAEDFFVERFIDPLGREAALRRFEERSSQQVF